MTSLQKCPRCGGSDLESGELKDSAHNVFFHPSSAPWLTVFPTAVRVEATMCLDCGAIELSGDVTRAREIARR